MVHTQETIQHPFLLAVERCRNHTVSTGAQPQGGLVEKTEYSSYRIGYRNMLQISPVFNRKTENVPECKSKKAKRTKRCVFIRKQEIRRAKNSKSSCLFLAYVTFSQMLSVVLKVSYFLKAYLCILNTDESAVDRTDGKLCVQPFAWRSRQDLRAFPIKEQWKNEKLSLRVSVRRLAWRTFMTYVATACATTLFL